MRCFSPVDAWQLESGDIVFSERGSILRALSLRCGQCIGCRIERSRCWQLRCLHESSMWPSNQFVTLTYADSSVYSLRYRDFQLFMKRLRRVQPGVRFYMCGEYGERFLRPHYHALLFNCDFSDRYLWRRSPSGFDLYRSAALESLWSREGVALGHCEIGDVNHDSAGYVARYCLKKVTGDLAEAHYQRVVAETGEVVQVEPEFSRMSLKPGIGAAWFAQYHRDVYPHDYVMVGDRKVKPPSYYDELLSRMPGFEIDDVEFDRYQRSLPHRSNSTFERLAVSEAVARAKLKSKVRNLE